MQINKKLANTILEKIKTANKIAIISHKNPDPDTIGSNATIKYIAEKLYNKQTESFCIDTIPPQNNNLKNIPTYNTELTQSNFDLLITVDCGSEAQTGYKLNHNNIINIDHHPSNNNYGTTNLVLETYASTTLILHHLLKIWKITPPPEIATLLLYGLYFDTGSFMHPNTTKEVYTSASELLQQGANQQLIIKTLFKNYTYNKLKLWGKTFSNLKANKKNNITTAITTKDFHKLKTTPNDLNGILNYLGTIKEAKIITLLKEDETTNTIKGSFRTNDDTINVSEIAKQLGGGGHKKASGFEIKGKLKKKVYWTIK